MQPFDAINQISALLPGFFDDHLSPIKYNVGKRFFVSRSDLLKIRGLDVQDYFDPVQSGNGCTADAYNVPGLGA